MYKHVCTDPLDIFDILLQIFSIVYQHKGRMMNRNKGDTIYCKVVISEIFGEADLLFREFFQDKRSYLFT